MEGGWKTPPPSATTRQKSPVLIGLTSMRLGLDGGCSLSGAPLTGSLGTLIDSRAFSDPASFADILLTSLFMDHIFFLLKPE